jgi:hypothetical protein
MRKIFSIYLFVLFSLTAFILPSQISAENTVCYPQRSVSSWRCVPLGGESYCSNYSSSLRNAGVTCERSAPLSGDAKELCEAECVSAYPIGSCSNEICTNYVVPTPIPPATSTTTWECKSQRVVHNCKLYGGTWLCSRSEHF